MLCDQDYVPAVSSLQDTTFWERVGSTYQGRAEFHTDFIPSQQKRYVSTQDMETILLESESFWLTKAKSDLEQIRKLPANWDGYMSPPISQDIAKSAEDFLNSLEYEDLPLPFVAPISGGTVQFEWKVQNRELEVEVVNGQTLGFLKVENGEPISEGEITDFSEIQTLIHWLKAA